MAFLRPHIICMCLLAYVVAVLNADGEHHYRYTKAPTFNRHTYIIPGKRIKHVHRHEHKRPGEVELGEYGDSSADTSDPSAIPTPAPDSGDSGSPNPPPASAPDASNPDASNPDALNPDSGDSGSPNPPPASAPDASNPDASNPGSGDSGSQTPAPANPAPENPDSETPANPAPENPDSEVESVASSNYPSDHQDSSIQDSSSADNDATGAGLIPPTPPQAPPARATPAPATPAPDDITPTLPPSSDGQESAGANPAPENPDSEVESAASSDYPSEPQDPSHEDSSSADNDATGAGLIPPTPPQAPPARATPAPATPAPDDITPTLPPSSEGQESAEETEPTQTPAPATPTPATPAPEKSTEGSCPLPAPVEAFSASFYTAIVVFFDHKILAQELSGGEAALRQYKVIKEIFEELGLCNAETLAFSAVRGPTSVKKTALLYFLKNASVAVGNVLYNSGVLNCNNDVSLALTLFTNMKKALKESTYPSTYETYLYGCVKGTATLYQSLDLDLGDAFQQTSDYFAKQYVGDDKCKAKAG